MRIHCIQHVPHEPPGRIATWARDRGHACTVSRRWTDDSLPALSTIDWLVVLGGPMSVDDEAEYPWLAAERDYVGRAICEGTVVVGVCLGAQLIAAALGAAVSEHEYAERGWFPVRTVPEAEAEPLLGDLPDEFPAFHWHGDSFDLPAGATHLFASEACANQGFLYGDRVLGLQFHLELARPDVAALLETGPPAGDGPYVQDRAALPGEESAFEAVNSYLDSVLDRLAART